MNFLIPDDMPNKLTDTEIKKALECCVTGDLSKSQIEVCEPCPYFECGDCTFQLKQNALDLINRQEAEIVVSQRRIATLEKLAEHRKKAVFERVERNLELRKELKTANAENESLKAEVERLNNNISAMATTLSASAKATRHEAYKECIERLKEHFTEEFCGQKYDLIYGWFNTTLNELVGNGDGKRKD